MSTITTFDLFPTIPVEIRLKIWSFALSNPRTITISCNKEVIIRGAPRRVRSWTTGTPSPSLLFVNREARYEALKIYEPHLSTHSYPCPIYLSFAQDVLKVVDGVLAYIPRRTLVEIQWMVLQTKDCAYFGFYNLGIVKSMKALKELEIYVERGVVYSWNHGDRYLDLLVSDFEDAVEADPGWECPRIRILDNETKNEVRLIEGGAKIPGWVPPEETTYVFQEDD